VVTTFTTSGAVPSRLALINKWKNQNQVENLSKRAPGRSFDQTGSLAAPRGLLLHPGKKRLRNDPSSNNGAGICAVQGFASLLAAVFGSGTGLAFRD